MQRKRSEEQLVLLLFQRKRSDEQLVLEVDDRCVLVSYDVTSLFTNVPVDETIAILVEKAFKDEWFNKENNLNMTKAEVVELLNIATKHQLFQFEGNLY